MKRLPAIAPVFVLAAAAVGAVHSLSRPQTLDALPATVSERAAEGARWRDVSLSDDRWHCTTTEVERPHGLTALERRCAQRVGVFALRWSRILRSAEGADRLVFVSPDVRVQRINRWQSADCPVTAPHGGIREGRVLQHARVGRGDVELLRCVSRDSNDLGRVEWLLAARAQAPGPRWIAAIVVACAAGVAVAAAWASRPLN